MLASIFHYFLGSENEVDSPDALLRVRYPVTNFSEKHVVDHGEGAPAMRSIPSRPMPQKRHGGAQYSQSAPLQGKKI
jgi:hypothetical protein